MADVAGVLRFTEWIDRSQLPLIFKISPDELAQYWRGEHRLLIVTGLGGNLFHLISLLPGPVAGLLDASQRSIPYNDAAARMPRGHKPVHDRVDHLTVRCEELTASRGDLNADPVVRRNQR